MSGNSAEHRELIYCPDCNRPVRLTTRGLIPRHSIEPGRICSMAGRSYTAVVATERDRKKETTS